MKIVQFTLPVSKESSVIVSEEIQPYFYSHLHRHVEVQISIILKGEGRLVVGNAIHLFQAGDIFLLGANLPHLFKSDSSYFEKDSGKLFHSISIFFNGQDTSMPLFQLPELANIKNWIARLAGGLKIKEADKKQVADKIFAVQEATGAQRISAFITLLNALSHLEKCDFLSTAPPQYFLPEKEGLRMNDVFQFTMKNYKEHIALEEIAAIAHMTPQAFCRYFKKHTQKTYILFLNEIRINEACKRLSARNYTNVATLAFESGFNNVTTFNRVFKQIRNISPLQFAQEFE